MAGRTWTAPKRISLPPLIRAAVVLVLCLLFPAAAFVADSESLPPEVRDERLRGLIEAGLLHLHGIGPDQVRATVENGVVTLEGTVPNGELADIIVGDTGTIQGVEEVVNRLEIMQLKAREPAEKSEGDEAGDDPGEDKRSERWLTVPEWLQPPPGRKTVRFPQGHLFDAPLADPKQPRSHATWQRMELDDGNFNIGSAGFGIDLSFLRWPGMLPGDGWQLGLSAAAFSIFNLDAPSYDLINTDFIVGIPLEVRSGPWSGRLRIYHQSSHLGDEYLLLDQPIDRPERLNISYESLEALIAREWNGYRIYAGGNQIFNTHTPLGRTLLQTGFEYRGHQLSWGAARLVFGADLQFWEELDYRTDISVKTGIRIRSPYSDAHAILFLLEFYDGRNYHGQFYEMTTSYYGFGISYAF